jgi:hypothetical protein
MMLVAKLFAALHPALQRRESRTDIFDPSHYTVDVMIGPDDSGHAVLAFEPRSQNFIHFLQASPADDG